MASTLVDDPRDVAFERLYSRYGRDVYRYVLALLRNPSEAEDVTQTTFLNAYRALRAGEEPHTPHHWLLTIAHNVCRSRVRAAMRRPREVAFDETLAELPAVEIDRPSVRDLVRAVRRLPFNQRAALAMRELGGRSYPEIADELGVTVPAVEALLARARRTLRLQAAALRGLAIGFLPRSLRRLAENGDAAGGAALGGVAAKAAAVIVAAGAVAGAVSYGGGSSHPARPAVQPRLELLARTPPAHASTARSAAHPHHAAAPRARATARPSSPAPPAVPARPRIVEDDPAPPPPAAAAPREQAQPAQQAPAAPLPAATTAAATAAPSAVSVPNVTVPAVEPPTVTVPSLPAPPAPPPLP